MFRTSAFILSVALTGTVLLKISCTVWRKARIAIGLRKIRKRDGFSIIFGDMLELAKHWDNKVYDWKTGILERYGPTVACYPTLFFDGWIITSDPKNVEHVLQTNFNNYIKPERVRKVLEPLFGQFLFNINHAHTADGGALWALLRKTSVKVFTRRAFREYCTTVFFRHAQHMIDDLQRACTLGEVVDMQRVFQSFTLESIFDIGMGRAIQDDERNFCFAFDAANQLALQRIIKPWFSVLGRWMESEQKLAACMAEVNAVAFRFVDERMAEDDHTLEGKEDILSHFLRLRALHPQLNDRTLLRDIVVGFITAGRDTMSSALTWTLEQLLQHADVLAEVLAEIQTGVVEACPSYETLHSLKLLDAVIHESMRLRPPVPFESKFAVHDDTLPDGSFVPAGVELQFSPYSMGHASLLWQDPELFRPRRWLEARRPSAFAYTVFQAGPRVCMGQALALTEMKAALVAVLSRFKFDIAYDSPRTYTPNFILSMKGGLPLRPSLRAERF